ncbi:MAG: type II toxin-antitoxin system prevent-host-death family antitoxin [Victivallales bacterium]|jgi:prevent-host-death family protein
MKTANIADFKANLSSFISLVEKGEEIEICKHNIPVARVLPLSRRIVNKTKLGCGMKTVKIMSDLTEPAISESAWEMLKK